MKILVPIKRVVDYNVKVRPLSDQSNVDLNNVKMSVNPFCEIALEEAVRLKESGAATEVIAVTVGKQDSQEQLRTALALGADRAILVESDSIAEPLVIAKALAKVCKDENPNLIKTMSVLPPRTNGKIRMVRIGENIDYQPCGGTHVKNTSEIGNIEIYKIENKGKLNKRIALSLI